jgi:ubiquinone/menaquinone biosynthesis C-methylase UbiE
MSMGKQPLDHVVAELLAPEPGEHVLELGHGPGTTLAVLARLQPAASYTGIDPSAVMHAQARRRVPPGADVHLEPAAAEDLPFAAATFDKAFTLNSIGHWESPPQALAEVHRVLKPGASLLVGTRRLVPGLAEALDAAGFTGTWVLPRPIGKREMVFVGAQRPV